MLLPRQQITVHIKNNVDRDDKKERQIDHFIYQFQNL